MTSVVEKRSIISEIYVVKKGELQFQKIKKELSKLLSIALSHLVVTPN